MLVNILSSASSTAEASRRAPSGVDAALLSPAKRLGIAALIPACVLPRLSPRSEEILFVKSPVRYLLARSTRFIELSAITFLFTCDRILCGRQTCMLLIILDTTIRDRRAPVLVSSKRRLSGAGYAARSCCSYR